MTATEFRTALAHLGMQQSWLAAELGVSSRTVNRWARGGLAVPRYVEAWLGLLVYPDERDEVLSEAKAASTSLGKARTQRLTKSHSKRAGEHKANPGSPTPADRPRPLGDAQN
jgi:DNA-binding XRE family transcriptional regulator